MTKEIIKIKSKPTEPNYNNWDIDVVVCWGDLEEVSNISEILAAFNKEGITDPSKMLFEYTEEFTDNWGDSTSSSHRFYYRKKGFTEAEDAYKKDLLAWEKWKIDNRGAIAAENKRQRNERKNRKIAKDSLKLKKEIEAAEAKLSKLKGNLDVHPEKGLSDDT